ncbi:GntR family transcriptional regulator [Alicyclobacillus fastidiosus]|uniref:GntR family transcriptional regulator n=1 Tax=Alicyclobacillus fastidiosus TaxID=392011 RepID=A0ABV5AD20_9BACL|nr:GntR family transcriptional regulator [Alicyclobacillus fastidiosus]WEH08801.1 GntR family transcriptional regulator [Alicyclobacillus fastidiosus]
MIGSFHLKEGKKTLGEQAYESIREDILSVRLQPGQTIYESEFAQRLNMSRTPIREAVHTLLVEGLIEVLPQRGMKIALISEKKVEETRFVRESLEVSALRQVARDWDSDHREYQLLHRELRMSLEMQAHAAQSQNPAGFLQADEQFHRLLLAASGNDTLISIVSQMRGHLNRVRVLSLQEIQNIDTLIQEHEQLLAAICERDEAKTISILSTHLCRLSEDIPVVKNKYPSFFTD